MAHDFITVAEGLAKADSGQEDVMDRYVLLPDKPRTRYSAKALKEWSAIQSWHSTNPKALTNMADFAEVEQVLDRMGAEYVGSDALNDLYYDVDGHRISVGKNGVEYIAQSKNIMQGLARPVNRTDGWERGLSFDEDNKGKSEAQLWGNPVQRRADEHAKEERQREEARERQREVSEKYSRDFTFYAKTDTGDLDFVIDHRGTHDITITPKQYWDYEDNPASLPPFKQEAVDDEEWVNPAPPSSYQPRMAASEDKEEEAKTMPKPMNESRPDKLSIKDVGLKTGWNSDQIRDFAREAGIPMSKRQRMIAVDDLDRMLDHIHGDRIGDKQAMLIQVGLLDIEDATHVVNMGLPAGDPDKAVAEAVAAKQARIAARGKPDTGISQDMKDRTMPDATQGTGRKIVDQIVDEKYGRRYSVEQDHNGKFMVVVETLVEGQGTGDSRVISSSPNYAVRSAATRYINTQRKREEQDGKPLEGAALEAVRERIWAEDAERKLSEDERRAERDRPKVKDLGMFHPDNKSKTDAKFKVLKPGARRDYADIGNTIEITLPVKSKDGSYTMTELKEWSLQNQSIPSQSREKGLGYEPIHETLEAMGGEFKGYKEDAMGGFTMVYVVPKNQQVAVGSDHMGYTGRTTAKDGEARSRLVGDYTETSDISGSVDQWSSSAAQGDYHNGRDHIMASYGDRIDYAEGKVNRGEDVHEGIRRNVESPVYLGADNYREALLTERDIVLAEYDRRFKPENLPPPPTIAPTVDVARSDDPAEYYIRFGQTDDSADEYGHAKGYLLEVEPSEQSGSGGMPDIASPVAPLNDSDGDGIADVVDPAIGERFVGREWETLIEEKLNNRVYLMEEATVDARLPFAVRVERENGEILATRRFEDEEDARRHMDSQIELGNRVAEANEAYKATPRGADEPNLLGATAEGIPKADNEHEMLNQSLDDSRTNYTMLGSWHLPGRERTIEHEKFIAGFDEVKGELERLEDAGEIYYIYSNGYVRPAIEGKALSAMPYDEYLKRRVTGEWPIPNADGEYDNRLDGWKAIEWNQEMERLKASELPRMTRAERIADFKEKQGYFDGLVESGELAQVYSNGYVLTNDPSKGVMRYDRYLAEQDEPPDDDGRGQMRPTRPKPSDPADGEALTMSRKSEAEQTMNEIKARAEERNKPNDMLGRDEHRLNRVKVSELAYGLWKPHDLVHEKTLRRRLTFLEAFYDPRDGTVSEMEALKLIESQSDKSAEEKAYAMAKVGRMTDERIARISPDSGGGMPDMASPVAPLNDLDNDGIADVVDPFISGDGGASSGRQVVDEIVDDEHGRRYTVEQDHNGKFMVVVETLVEGQGAGDSRVINSSPSYAARGAATRFINRERKREEQFGIPDMASPVAPLNDLDNDGIADVVDPVISEDAGLGGMLDEAEQKEAPATWTKKPTRGTGQAQILESGDIRLVKGKGWNNFWKASRISDNSTFMLESGNPKSLKEAKADLAAGRYTMGEGIDTRVLAGIKEDSEPPPPTPIRPDVEILPPIGQAEPEPQATEQPEPKGDGWETVTEEVDERRNVKYIHKASADGLSHIVITETLGDLPDDKDSFANIGYSAETIDVSNLYTKAGATRYLKNQKGLGEPEEEDKGRLLMSSTTNPDYDTQGGTYKRDVHQVIDEERGYRHTVKQPYGFGAGYVVVTETLDGEHVTASKEYKSLGAVTRYLNKNNSDIDKAAERKAERDDEPKGVDDLIDMIAPVAEAGIEVAMERGGGISTMSEVSLSQAGGGLDGGDIVMAVVEEEIPGSSLAVDIALDAADTYEPTPAKAKKAKKKKGKGRSRADIISAATSKATATKKRAAPKRHPFLSKAESRRR